ncbi:alpha/beta hydrolase [Halosimplex salinum]|uniref:alpha/beta hydrolase n=1 Tax=Halosimplex salinum TaxID=1710538 RepID=UPI000F4678C6|nr:alpha/beta hydrolase [Halosimplex salinum]
MNVDSRTVEARDGATLHCLERVPDDATEAVVLVHGSITNARALFATPVRDDDSYSWLHAVADRGRAAFALDVRGYGDSDLPPEMDEPPEASGPPVRADRAADDVAAAVDSVREEYDGVHLVGVSWGCHTCGRFVERDDPELASLTQCAPVYKPRYDFDEGMAALGLDSVDVAWYTQDRETVRERQGGDDALFEAIWRAQVESNQGIDDTTYRAQTGALADWRASCEGDPVWDPAAIDVPTLVVRGTEDAIADRPGSLDHFDELTVETADYVELAGVDHYPMHSDRRQEFFAVVDEFQDRAG